ncbi:MAG: type I DNA topoisomerase [Bacteroidales bacterium]|nr:type I DNA topoisomerase [Bacteroidales bacterium]
MEGNLVIVESPAKAGTIQKFLGKDYIVKSSFGHIRDLQDKKLSIDVEHGFEPEYIIPVGKKKVVAELKAAAAKAGTVWLASDEDREGEAISWHLSQTLGLDPANTRRIVFHEITKDAILNAISNPRGIDMNLVKAQQARRVLDRLVGFELSPLLWRKVKRGLSAGRVQSVALRLVVDKEKEIMAFKSEPYYRIEAVFDIKGTKVKGLLDEKFKDIKEAEKFLTDSIGADYSVSSVSKKEGTRFPAPPFTTSTLQQEAARKLRFPVSLTMRIAQSLYERGLITYMRTDSTNLSSLALGTAKQLITDNFGKEYLHTRQYKTSSKGAQEAHEAIRPTYISNTSIEGSVQEQKLYDLIWKRTVASQMEEARVLSTTIKVGSDKRDEKFSIQATQIIFDGFLKLYLESVDDGEENGEDVILPEISEGEVITAKALNADCKFTQPPYRYSEASLVKKLEELGIGRPSTYAPTINTLTTARGYLLKGDKPGSKVQVKNLTLKGNKVSAVSRTETVGAEKGKLFPQDIGILVSDYLVANFSDIMDYDFTANVEKDFDRIAEGRLVWQKQIDGFYAPFHKKVEDVLNDHQYNHVEREIGKDPASGEMITAKFGPFGAYVQKGEGDSRQCVNLSKGQLIDSLTLEDALKLFALPRTIGEYKGVPVTAMKGRFGPYLKYGDRNVSLPKNCDPLTITLEDCESVLEQSLSGASQSSVIREFTEGGFTVLNGRYGPYIRFNGSNYRIPSGTDPQELTEEACKKIVEEAKNQHYGKLPYRRNRS